jgi:hypothetical protein
MRKADRRSIDEPWEERRGDQSEGRSIPKGGLEGYQSRKVLGERNEELDKGNKSPIGLGSREMDENIVRFR